MNKEWPSYTFVVTVDHDPDMGIPDAATAKDLLEEAIRDSGLDVHARVKEAETYSNLNQALESIVGKAT